MIHIEVKQVVKRTRHRVGEYFKFSDDMPVDEVTKLAKEIAQKKMDSSRRWRLFCLDVRFDLDNEDFIKCMNTCVIRFNALRTARIFHTGVKRLKYKRK